MTIIQWLVGLGFTMPGLSFLTYIIAGAILLVIIDCFLCLLFSGLSVLFSGGRMR